MNDTGQSPRRIPLVAGNWKMHKTAAETRDFLTRLLPLLNRGDAVEVGICPSFLALRAAVEAAADSGVQIYAQNMHQAPGGAFTGEVSAPMLREVGVDGVVLGHSERRAHFGENDRELQLKVVTALDAQFVPILCVGESEEERERGDTERRLRHQVQEDLHRVDNDRLSEVVIAYEPVWAIGTGRVATPDQAQDAIAFIRALVADRSADEAQRTRILYGGSVNIENAAELLTLPDVDGALVGGASLDPDSFAAIVAAAA
jgi:triosephosphate isomerase (TIM)